MTAQELAKLHASPEWKETMARAVRNNLEYHKATNPVIECCACKRTEDEYLPVGKNHLCSDCNKIAQVIADWSAAGLDIDDIRPILEHILVDHADGL